MWKGTMNSMSERQTVGMSTPKSSKASLGLDASWCAWYTEGQTCLQL